MMKKLGVRWLPGLPFLNEPKVSHTFSRPGDFGGLEPPLPLALAAAAGGGNGAAGEGAAAGIMASPENTALVLVLVQDPNIKMEKGQQQKSSSLVWLGR